MLERNVIHLGDSLEELQKLPAESVDMCITAPPYYNLRDYKKDRQIGLEESYQDYVNDLCNIFDEVQRVLKKTGVCWVNIGDTYIKKCLAQIPSRFEIEMTNRGWILRNEVIWSKPNPQPMSAKDRFWVSHEKLYMFTKVTKGYYFDQPRVPQKEISIRRAFSKNNISKRKDKDAHGKEGFAISSVNQASHYEKLRKRIEAGETLTRPKFTVWDISTKSYRGAHFAVYPPELIADPILSSCPEGGVVLDPFIGSGTTAVVALENNRDFIGFEINDEYRELAIERIRKAQAHLVLNDG